MPKAWLSRLALVLLAITAPGCAGGEQVSPFCAAVDKYAEVALGPGGTARQPEEAMAALDVLIERARSEQDRAVFAKMREAIAYRRDKTAGKEVGEAPPGAEVGEITKAFGAETCAPPQ